MQFHRIPQLRLCFVVENSLGNLTSAALNWLHCIGRDLDPSVRVVDVLNQDGA